MGKHCENCGCLMEKVGCPNCNEKDVNEYYDYLLDKNTEVYEKWKG